MLDKFYVFCGQKGMKIGSLKKKTVKHPQMSYTSTSIFAVMK